MPTAGRKICMLGDFGVGKTSLVRRYVIGDFSPTYHATIGVNIYKYTDTGDGGAEPRLNQIIWDIEGSDPNAPMLSAYMHGAAGAIVVGDITRTDTADAMAGHARGFLSARPGRPLVFGLNKTDLVAEPGSHAAPDALRHEFGTETVATSALSGEAVPELFRTLASAILRVGA